MFAWSEAFTEFIGFVFSFFATGAVAFRLFVLRNDVDREVLARGSRRAAVIGLLGAAGSLVMLLAFAMPRTAARQHTSVAHAMTATSTATIQTVCAFMLVVAFGLAFSRIESAWIIAALCVIAAPFAPLLTSDWTHIVNPVHRLAGGFWIGGLFVMLAAGFSAVARSSIDPVRRGALAAKLVHAFSPLALISFAVLATSGIITAWRHLKRLDALWTTPYGYALIAKLCVVAVVMGLGAWNWRRQRPLLGTESAAAVLRRSATAEVIAATIVLVITSILVTLPSPR